MGFELTDRAQLLADQPNKKLQLILEINGIDLIFGAQSVSIVWRIGNDANIGDSGLVIGGTIEAPNSRDYIMSEGTTKSLSQQIQPDKKSGSSVPTPTIRLTDKDGELTSAFQPGNNVADILFRRAELYSSFVGAAHPKDSVPIVLGVISDIEYGSGYVDIKISNAEQKKRQTIFQVINTKLNGGISDSDTSLTLDTTNGMFEPVDILTTYVKINDEIIKYTGISGNDLTGLVRGQFGTSAAAHSDDDDVGTIYQFIEKPIELALKLMTSGSGSYATEGATDFQQLTATEFVTNAIRFNVDVELEYGVTVGSLVTVTGASEGANNVTDAAITEIVTTDYGSYVIVNATLATENSSSATASFSSEFDTLPDGCSMTPQDIDVAQFNKINDLFSASFPTYDFRLDDSIDAKNFLDEEVFFPAGLFSVPRKAKTSVQYTLPPLAEATTPVIDGSNVTDPDKIKIKRSINKNFYNTIIYKFEKDVTDGEFKAGVITEDNDSINRISAGTRPLTIESSGLRNDANTLNFINRQTQRFLNRFKFAAESLSIDVTYGAGFVLDVADTVIFKGEELKISDVSTGDRNFLPRIMEIVNFNKNFVNGKVRIDILDTNFAIQGRYGVISPSSKISTGASTTSLPLKTSFGTPAGGRERTKWLKYIGEKVKVHSPDFSNSEEVTFSGFNAVSQNTMEVTPALGFTPSEDDIVDIADYPSSTDKSENALYKDIFCFWTPQVDVVSGTSSTVFDVAAGHVSKFFVGALIEVHTTDYSSVSPEVNVTDITGTTITVDEDMGFTPTSAMKVDFIGFADEGEPYRML